MKIERLLFFMIFIAAISSVFLFAARFFMNLSWGGAMFVASVGIFLGIFIFWRYVVRG